MWPFGKSKREQTQTKIVPPVDLNKPVENPHLSAAILEHSQIASVESGLEVVAQLNRANYLVVYFDDEMKITRGKEEGQVIFEKDSLLKMPTCSDENGRTLLPLFTDWNEIKAWIDKPVATLVMPARQAWSWVLEQNYEGAIVNPAGLALPLDLNQVRQLLSEA